MKQIVARPPLRPSARPFTSSTFGAERRLDSAVRERRYVARAAAAAPEPVKQQLQKRGDFVARQIARLQSRVKNGQ